MFDAKSYISRLTQQLESEFSGRLCYVGLQGSYMRGEVHEGSDIDIMVVIDGLCADDLRAYRRIIDSLEQPESSCGFIYSRQDLANWNRAEIFHLLGSTRDHYGSLAQLVPQYSEADVRTYTKLSVNNLYHALCHRFIHAGDEVSVSKLPGMFKGVFYILQDKYFLEHGVFINKKSQLLPLLSGLDREAMECVLDADRAQANFEESFDLLLQWCQQTQQRV